MRKRSLFVATFDALLYALAALLLVGAGILIWHFVDQNPWPFAADANAWGPVGDFFGGTLNPIVGLLSICLLVTTLRLQQRASDHQNEQLEAQKVEQAATLAELERQRFEQTFFAWLQTYHQVVETVSAQSKTGRAALIEVLEEKLIQRLEPGAEDALAARRRIATNAAMPNDNNHASIPGFGIALFTVELMDQFGSRIAAPAATLRKLFLWIESQPERTLSSESKQTYIDIVWSQLSDAEAAFVVLETFYSVDLESIAFLKRRGRIEALKRSSRPTIRYIATFDPEFLQGAIQNQLLLLNDKKERERSKRYDDRMQQHRLAEEEAKKHRPL